MCKHYLYIYIVKPIIFCYYCDRTFENEKVLIQHQRAKHFKCIVCHKRLGSAHGMMVHVFQVHKQQIDKVPHAKEGRDSFHIDIFGMSNIPKEVIDEKHAERGILYHIFSHFHTLKDKKKKSLGIYYFFVLLFSFFLFSFLCYFLFVVLLRKQ